MVARDQDHATSDDVYLALDRGTRRLSRRAWAAAALGVMIVLSSQLLINCLL